MNASALDLGLVGTQRLLAARDPSLDEHLRMFGPVPAVALAELISITERAGLTGRGGAGFPTARKLRAVSEGRDRPVVVGNAMEGEFLSDKDRTLLARSPHLVLDGLEMVGRALHGGKLVLATGDRIDSGLVRSAVHARRSSIDVRDLGGGFLGGQESALVSQLNRRPAVPQDPHTPVYARGVDARPTLVVNVETLAHLALVVRFGPDWFRSQGTPDDPGTFLVTLTGALRPGVQEIARGSRLGALLEAAGADRARLSGVLLGGYHGTWLPPQAFDVALSITELAAYGARPGAGIVHALDRTRCPLRVGADIMSYLARQTSGQCGPCINGMPRMAETLHRLAVPGADARLVGEVTRLRGLVTGRGACAHPDGSARFVMSTLSTFSEHVDAHLRGECHAAPVD